MITWEVVTEKLEAKAREEELAADIRQSTSCSWRWAEPDCPRRDHRGSRFSARGVRLVLWVVLGDQGRGTGAAVLSRLGLGQRGIPPRHGRGAVPRGRRAQRPGLADPRPGLRARPGRDENLLPCAGRQAQRAEVGRLLPDHARWQDHRHHGLLHRGADHPLGQPAGRPAQRRPAGLQRHGAGRSADEDRPGQERPGDQGQPAHEGGPGRGRGRPDRRGRCPWRRRHGPAGRGTGDDDRRPEKRHRPGHRVGQPVRRGLAGRRRECQLPERVGPEPGSHRRGDVGLDPAAFSRDRRDQPERRAASAWPTRPRTWPSRAANRSSRPSRPWS